MNIYHFILNDLSVMDIWAESEAEAFHDAPSGAVLAKTDHDVENNFRRKLEALLHDCPLSDRFVKFMVEDILEKQAARTKPMMDKVSLLLDPDCPM